MKIQNRAVDIIVAQVPSKVFHFFCPNNILYSRSLVKCYYIINLL